MPQKQPSSRTGSTSRSNKSSKKNGGRNVDRSESVSMSPLSDLEFDVISVLYQKAKALEAYDKYLEDADASREIKSVLERIREDDAEHVRMLRECIGTLGIGGEIEA